MRLRASHELPGSEIVRGTRKRANALRGQQVGLDSRGDAAGDFVLHGEDVAELAVVAFGPVMAAGCRIDELRADAQPLAGAAHAAFEHVADAELARDLFHVDRTVLVDERRVAGDDEQPADAGEPGDQVLGNAVGKILLIGIAAHIGERQDRDRGTVGQRQSGVLPVCRGVDRSERVVAGPGVASSRTSPTKRMPLRGRVLIRRCLSPVSPMALRAALMRLNSADSDTMRPCHTEASRSSLLTTRSRCRIK